MRKLLLFFALFVCKESLAQQAQCAVTTSYTLTYQSTDGAGNCTFLFKPTVTINQSGASVKLVRYTFTVGNTTVNVCYSDSPVVIANCNGSFNAMPSGANQVFPTATVVLPCSSGSLVMTGSTSAQGASTCTTQQVYSGPLPVKLVSFSGAAKPNGVKLNWVTEWESINAGFDVQKSTNAKSFEVIGTIKGNATTNQASTYEFTDQDVQPGQLYYYRLKQNDVDGSFTYSQIVAVRYTADQDIQAKVYPNATTGDSFMLSMLKAQSATVRLFTQAGVELPVTVTKTGDPNLVSVVAQSPLAKGIYLLKLSSADSQQQKSLKVVVQ
ncbi:T9SS type A sorting domain-containing protein [Spirosoma radiotolerans]|uniref:T9SS type A sorting domain-containing protein n=1 Tax=Spirosoma radiotolerans TaxID=1379870 RepID=UPI00069781DB|nr:T9SS type A sorting domain-containing protein [Spirosoma radiotolerans]